MYQRLVSLKIMYSFFKCSDSFVFLFNFFFEFDNFSFDFKTSILVVISERWHVFDCNLGYIFFELLYIVLDLI